MKKLKNKLLTGLLATTALASTSLAAITLASCNKNPVTPVDPEEESIFNIKDGVVYGFKEGVTEQQKKDYCKDGVLKLPAVKVIAEGAFSVSSIGDAPYISEIVISSQTASIGKKAFYGNRASSITWEGGVGSSGCTLIDEEAFGACSQLLKFEFPKGLFTTDSSQGIRKNAFFGCGKLTTLDLTMFDFDSYIEKPNWVDNDAFDGMNQGISTECKLIFKNPTGTTATDQELEMYNCAHIYTRLTVAGLSTAWQECWEDGTPWDPQIKCVPVEYLNISDTTLVGANETLWPTGESEERGYNAVWVPHYVDTLDANINTFFADRTRKTGETDTGINAWLFNWSKISTIPAGACAGVGIASTKAYWPNKNTQYDMPGITSIGANAFNQCPWILDIPSKANVTSIGANAFTDSRIDGWIFNGSMTHVGNYAFANALYIKSLDFQQITAKPDYQSGDPVWGTNVFQACGTGTQETGQIAQIHYFNNNKVDNYRIYTDFQAFLKTEGLGLTGDDPIWVIQPVTKLGIQDIFNVTSDGHIKGWAVGDQYEPKTELTKDEVTAILNGLGSEFTGTLEIPKKIGDVTVTAIDENAFKAKLPDIVTKIVIPDSVTIIGASAFESNTSTEENKGLQEVVIPNSVVTMGIKAFKDCSKLATIDLSTYTTAPSWNVAFDSETFAGLADTGTVKVYKYKDGSQKREVDQWRLNYPIKLKLTNGGLDFTKWVFDNADEAIMVNIDTTDDKNIVDGWAVGTAGVLTDLEKYAMAIDKYEEPSLVIPANAKSIAANAFYTTSSSIPNTLTKISFAQNSALTAIGSQSFRGTPTATVDFTNATSLETIGENAFATSSVATVTSLPDSLKTIDAGAFCDTKLTSIKLPATNLTTIGIGAFSYISTLQEIDMSAYDAVPNWTADAIFNDIYPGTDGVIKVQTGVSGIKDYLALHSNTIANNPDYWTETAV